MNTDLICKHLNVTKDGAITKARELFRLSQLKSPSLREAEVCRSAACVELACQLLDCPVDHRKAARFSMAPEKVYNTALVTLQKVLNIGTKLTTKDLCLIHGCTQIEDQVRKALLAYRDRFSRTVAQTALVDFGRPVFVVVSFFLVAQKNKVKVDRKPLLLNHGISKEEFERVLQSMTDLCPEFVKEVKKRGRTEQEGGGGAGREEGAGPSGREQGGAKKARTAALGPRTGHMTESVNASCSEDDGAGEGSDWEAVESPEGRVQGGRRDERETSSPLSLPPAPPPPAGAGASNRASNRKGRVVAQLGDATVKVDRVFRSVTSEKMLRQMTLGYQSDRPKRKAAPPVGSLKEKPAGDAAAAE